MVTVLSQCSVCNTYLAKMNKQSRFNVNIIILYVFIFISTMCERLLEIKHVQQFKTEKVIRHISRSHKVHRQFSISYLCHLKRISNRSGKHTRDRHKDLVKLAKKGDASLFNNQLERNYQKSTIENQNVENKEGR